MTVFCLVVERGSLGDHMRDVLFLGAVALLQDRSEERALRSSQCEGVVRTEFRPAQLGSICGTKFAASLDTDHGRVEITYIVRDRDIDNETARQAYFDRIRGEGGSPWISGTLEFTDDDLACYRAVPPTRARQN